MELSEAVDTHISDTQFSYRRDKSTIHAVKNFLNSTHEPFHLLKAKFYTVSI
jgi:hypothetical protein